MFKAQILRRSFSLFRRVPNSTIIQSAARDGHETIHIQRVRFKKPFFSRSRLLGTVILTASAYGFLRWLDEEDVEEYQETHRSRRVRQRRTEEESASNGDEEVDEDAGDQDEREDEHEEEEEEEGEGLLFFPTGFSRPKPRTFYKGSDPEWQEFVRLSEDRQRLDRIRLELVAIVRDLAVKNPQYVLRLGKINPNAGGIWIETKFPEGPPIEFERPGIELTEDLTLRKTTRPVHELHHHRLSNVLVPTAAANSLYYDTKRRAEKSWHEFKTYIGNEDKNKPPKAQKLLTQFPAPPPTSPKSPVPTTAATSTSTPPPTTSTATSTANDTQQQPAPSTSTPSTPPLGNPAYERFGIALPDPSKAPTIDLSHFRQLFRKHHRHYHIQPPRGTFIVSGLIEIIGERAKMTLDVAAAYDPRIGRYVMLRARMRSVADFKQMPKGGP